jgi:hypothetical protein
VIDEGTSTFVHDEAHTIQHAFVEFVVVSLKSEVVPEIVVTEFT